MVCIKGQVMQPNWMSVCGGERPEPPALGLGIQTRDMAWKERSDPQPIIPAHQRVWTQKVGSGNRQRANRTARRVDPKDTIGTHVRRKQCVCVIEGYRLADSIGLRDLVFA